MSTAKKIFYVNGDDVQMKPAPISPGWIIEGTPVARNCLLSRARDHGASAYLWDCTAGVFNWRYDTDETAYILGGLVVVRDVDGVEHKLGPGDHALFPAGSHAVWRVPAYVRKVCFTRTPVPRAIVALTRRVRLLSKTIAASRRPTPTSSLSGY